MGGEGREASVCVLESRHCLSGFQANTRRLFCGRREDVKTRTDVVDLAIRHDAFTTCYVFSCERVVQVTWAQKNRCLSSQPWDPALGDCSHFMEMAGRQPDYLCRKHESRQGSELRL